MRFKKIMNNIAIIFTKEYVALRDLRCGSFFYFYTLFNLCTYYMSSCLCFVNPKKKINK